MASTTASDAGSTVGRNLATTSPPGEIEELLEVPLDVAGLPFGVGELSEHLVERVPLGPVDVDLLGHRKGHAVGGRAEGLDLLGAARLLAPELVARHARGR